MCFKVGSPDVYPVLIQSLTASVTAGPIQNPDGGTCWLDSVLALGLALTPLAAWPAHLAQLDSQYVKPFVLRHGIH